MQENSHWIFKRGLMALSEERLGQIPKTVVSLQLHEECVQDPKNLYLALPFTGGKGDASRIENNYSILSLPDKEQERIRKLSDRINTGIFFGQRFLILDS